MHELEISFFYYEKSKNYWNPFCFNENGNFMLVGSSYEYK